jgi:alpha-1,6-mannosyltransferase
LRICDVTQAYHPTSGGIRTYLQEKRRFILQRTDWEHALVVPGAEDAVRREGRLLTITVRGVPIPGCAPYRLALRSERLRAAVQAVCPDVVELGTAYLTPALDRSATGATAITAFYHTDVPRAYVAATLRRVGRRTAFAAARLAARYIRGVHRRLDVTFAASPSLVRWLRRIGAPRATYLPLGADLELFHPARRDPALRLALGVGDGDRIIIFAGRLDSEKRIPILLDAFRRVPASVAQRLVLVGDGPEQPRCVAAAARDGRVLVLPYERNRTRLATLLASADIYATAAPHETFGLSVLEAQASGLAVAGVRAGAMPERVPPDVGALTTPDSPDALARAITELCLNGYRERGRRARELVVGRFGWDATFERQFTIYRELCHA